MERMLVSCFLQQFYCFCILSFACTFIKNYLTFIIMIYKHAKCCHKTYEEKVDKKSGYMYSKITHN